MDGSESVEVRTPARLGKKEVCQGAVVFCGVLGMGVCLVAVVMMTSVASDIDERDRRAAPLQPVSTSTPPSTPAVKLLTQSTWTTENTSTT